MNNFLQIAGHSFSVMFFEPRLNDSNYINLPMKRRVFMERMSHYKDGGKTFEFYPVLTNITWREPETIGLKARYSYEELTELNYLAYLISELDDSELNIYKAILSYGMELAVNDDKLRWLINLTENTVNYDHYPYVFSLYDLGKAKLLQSFSATSFPEELEVVLDLFDFTEIGTRFLKKMKGHLFTPGGFIEVMNNDPWKIIYTGKMAEIPEEYRLTN